MTRVSYAIGMAVMLSAGAACAQGETTLGIFQTTGSKKLAAEDPHALFDDFQLRAATPEDDIALHEVRLVRDGSATAYNPKVSGFYTHEGTATETSGSAYVYNVGWIQYRFQTFGVEDADITVWHEGQLVYAASIYPGQDPLTWVENGVNLGDDGKRGYAAGITEIFTHPGFALSEPVLRYQGLAPGGMTMMGKMADVATNTKKVIRDNACAIVGIVAGGGTKGAVDHKIGGTKTTGGAAVKGSTGSLAAAVGAAIAFGTCVAMGGPM